MKRMAVELAPAVKGAIGFQEIAPTCATCRHCSVTSNGNGGQYDICNLFGDTLGFVILNKPISNVCAKHQWNNQRSKKGAAA